MADLTVKDLDEAVIERLKERADRNERTLEAELREILEDASGAMDRSAWAVETANRIRRILEGRTHSDSAEMIREDRDA